MESGVWKRGFVNRGRSVLGARRKSKLKCGVFGAYHIKGRHSVNLDQAMEPAEQDGHREQQEIARVADVVSQQLDELADEHPQHQQAEEGPPRPPVPTVTALPVQEKEEAIPGERVVGDGG